MNNSKYTNIHVIGVPEREVGEKRKFKEIRPTDFQIL